MKFALKEGINDCTNTEYHSDKLWLSSSSFKKVRKNSAAFYDEEILGNRPPELEKGYLTEGSLTHSLILEPHLVQSEYAFYEGMRKQGAQWDSFKADPANVGRTIVSAPQKAKAYAYHRAYLQNEEAVELIGEGGLSEHTICQIFNDVPTKVRADRINVDKGFIADVKTSSFGVTKEEAEQTVRHWEYELSAALYAAVFEQYYGKLFDFFWIFISKTDLECRVYKMSDTTRMRGMKMYREGLETYKRCLATGDWSVKEQSKIKQLEIEEI